MTTASSIGVERVVGGRAYAAAASICGSAVTLCARPFSVLPERGTACSDRFPRSVESGSPPLLSRPDEQVHPALVVTLRVLDLLSLRRERTHFLWRRLTGMKVLGRAGMPLVPAIKRSGRQHDEYESNKKSVHKFQGLGRHRLSLERAQQTVNGARTIAHTLIQLLSVPSSQNRHDGAAT